MKRKPVHLTHESKRGVALIVVLGFLSIMIIMAVAFLTQSRTERMVADATLEAQRGRELVRTGLNAAMNDYSVELWNPDRFMLPPPSMEVFPSIAPVGSADMGRTIGQDNIRLMIGEARRWLPRRYLTQDVTNDVAGAEWILVREDPTDSRSRILGRYAYACFDMSGGIDANLVALDSGVANVGNATNRSSVRGVGMGELPETADASTFKTLRRGWHGFDNLAELILLTNGKYNGGEQDYEDEDDESKSWPPPSAAKRRWKGDRVEYSPGLTSSEVSDLVPYSLAAYRGEWDWGAGDWSSANIQTCDEDTDWDAVLTDVTGMLENKNDTVKALEDYVSSDPAPQGVDYPSSKNVPMFNELEMSFNLRFVANPPTNRLILDVTLEFETWYPFPSDDNAPSGSFQITAPTMGGGYSVLPTGGEDIWMRCRLRTGAQVDMAGSPDVASLTVTPDFNNGDPLSAGVISYALEVTPVGTGVVFAATDILQIQSVKVPEPILMEGGASAVDQMQLEVDRGMNLVVNTPETFSYEVDDPRLNHDKDHWEEADPPTMNAVNAAATAAGYADPGGEGLYLYCRNGPMDSPAELGFISTGRPWETIDLCTVEGATMLSKLVSSTNIVADLQSSASHNTFYTNGTINPNTSSTNVLLAAFTGLLKREVPNVADMPGGEDGPLTQDQARDLAGSIIFEAGSKQIESSGHGAYLAGSDWVRVPAMGIGGVLAGQGLNKNQRETLIRSTWGLFSPNNSMFTVLVIGQPIKEGPAQVGIWNSDDDMITGERRGVALVWRDPTPSGAAGHHEMFVRMFKFLDE